MMEVGQKCMFDILNEAKRQNPAINTNYNDDINKALIIIEDKALAMVGKIYEIVKFTILIDRLEGFL